MRAVNHQHSPTPEEIMEYLDGEGAPATRETIAAHLATCGECQAVAAAQRDISRHAQAWTIGHPPASLTAPEGPRASWAVLVAWIRQPRAAALTVSAAAVVLVLMSMTGGSAKRMLTPAKQARPVAAAAEAVQYQPGHQARGEAVGGAVGGVVGRLAGTPPPPRRGDVTASLPAAVPEAVAQVRTPSIIRTATLRLIAKDVSSARAKVESVVDGAKGFVDQMTVTGDASVQRQLVARLRVPGDRLADTLARLRQLGAVIEDTQGSEDVTDQIVDLDARLANARATEKRLAEILHNRTGRLSDVLEVERELARVRLDIERLDAEKTNIGRRVTYATIDLTISEERKSADSPLTLGTRLRLAALDGIENVMDTALSLVLFVLRAGPALLFWGVVLTLGWFAAQRIFRVSGPSA